MTRIMIIGGAGLLGHKLCQLLKEKYEVIATVRRSRSEYEDFVPIFRGVELVEKLDALEGESLERAIRDARPNVVVNCVGIVSQLAAANDRYLSVALNSLLPHRIARTCAEIGARSIYPSTDCVFDGTRGGYIESDSSDARDVYGKSKYLGETTLEEPGTLTLRSSIIGREIFLPSHGLVEWFLAQRGKRIRGFERAIFTGFTTHEYARILQMLIDDHSEISGMYHVASMPITKYALLCKLHERLELDVEIERDDQFVCDRSLTMSKFAKDTGYVAPSWDEMLDVLCRDTTPYDAWHVAMKQGN